MTAIVEDPDRSPSELSGIGKDLATKIVALVESGTLPQLDEMRKKIPSGVVEMLRLPGMGPKKVAILFHELSLTTLEELKQAAEQQQIRALKGFGKKTEESILEGLEHAQQSAGRVFLADAKAQADAIFKSLSQLACVQQIATAGSLRRRRETVGDLDMLITANDSTEPMDALANHDLVEKVLARGETKQRVRLRSGLEMDLRVVPEESYGAALQYFTGSKAHNIVARRRAQERGLKINEYGVYRGD
jgi:DNA polymerase (family 10)